jgi:hypothetical protein
MFLNACVIFALSSAVCFSSINPRTNPQEYLDYGQAEHFAPVGKLVVSNPTGSICDNGVATLVRPNKILTCAHNFQTVQELGDNNIYFALRIDGYERSYKVLSYMCHPEFRRGGPDIAFATLEKSVDQKITPAIIGLISNEDLSARIYDDIPSYGQDDTKRKYYFSCAGIGRTGCWTDDPKGFYRDELKRGFNVQLKSRMITSSSTQYPISEHLFTANISEAKHLNVIGGGAPGFSGAPLFIINKTSSEPKWRLIGVEKSSDRSLDFTGKFEDHGTEFTPINCDWFKNNI